MKRVVQQHTVLIAEWVTMHALIRTYALLLLLSVQSLGMLSASLPKSLDRQKRAWIIDMFTIEEEHQGSFPYFLGNISLERDYRVDFHLHGQGVDEEPKDLLQIDQDTGIITVHRAIDYERYTVLHLTFEARKDSKEVDTRLGVEINILDINDNAPKFQRDVYETTIDEWATQGSDVITVLATDYDKRGTPNSTFEYSIVSVTPKTSNVEFFIAQTGKISFKGCLDNEKAEKYKVVVQAKDKGEVVQLSSHCTVFVNVLDKNNHLPTFSGRSGTGRVKERESGVPVLRLHVTDKDTKGTPAWRGKYTVQGDKDKYFSVHTDPETNDGILVVQKPLDFEQFQSKNVTVSVENVETFFSCTVQRKTDTGLWEVLNIGGPSGKGVVPTPFTQHVTVFVDDVNDPPVFNPLLRNVMVVENTPSGYLLGNMTAVDLDATYSSELVYSVSVDADSWVTVDAKTGKIMTAKTVDRESPHVVGDTYNVTILAVDKGTPPLTGTGTLVIHVKDQNDNEPVLREDMFDMCLPKGPVTANISAYDLDGHPFSGPFRFELLGDVKGKWHLSPFYGMTATLVKENMVHAGLYELQVKTSDTQGLFSVTNISVAVCDCSVSPHCRMQRVTGSQVHISAFGIMLTGLLVLLGVLLLAFLISCKNEKPVIPPDPAFEERLLSSNIEIPGTDCEIPNGLLLPQKSHMEQSLTTDNGAAQKVQVSQQSEGHYLALSNSFQERRSFSQRTNRNSLQRGMSIRTLGRSGVYQQTSVLSRSLSMSRQNSFLKTTETLRSFINRRINTIQAGEDWLQYDPQPYTYEGDPVTDYQLDNISIPDIGFTLDMLQDLSPRFNSLAAICKPTPDGGSATHGTTTIAEPPQ